MNWIIKTLNKKFKEKQIETHEFVKVNSKFDGGRVKRNYKCTKCTTELEIYFGCNLNDVMKDCACITIFDSYYSEKRRYSTCDEMKKYYEGLRD